MTVALTGPDLIFDWHTFVLVDYYSVMALVNFHPFSNTYHKLILEIKVVIYFTYGLSSEEAHECLSNFFQ